VIYRALKHCEKLMQAGWRDAAEVAEEMKRVLSEAPDLRPEYIGIVDAESLEPCDPIRGRVLVAVAARLGATRLIDNIVVDTTVL